MYLTYDDYKALGGALDETTFIVLELRAESIVNWHTFNRLKGEKTFSDDVKKCMFLLITMLNKQQQIIVGTDDSGQKTIASQSNDGVSITYNNMGAKDAFTVTEEEVVNIIQQTLNGVCNSLGHRLLYRGVYPNE